MAIAIKSLTITVNTGSSPTVSVTTSETPSATQVGDLVLVIHGNDFYGLANMPTPTATGSPTLAPVTGGSADAGANHAHVKSYTYVANTAGAQTISVTETGSADEEKALIVRVLSGADTSTPIDIAGSAFSAAAAATHVLPSINTTASDDFLIAHDNSGGGSSSSSYTPPVGMTEQYDSVTGGYSHTGATEQLAASGATGTRTFDNATDVEWAGVLIAVKTAASGPPPTPPLFVRPLTSGRRWR